MLKFLIAIGAPFCAPAWVALLFMCRANKSHWVLHRQSCSESALLLRYQAKLEALYTALEERQKARLQALMEGTGGTVAERIEQVCNICFLPWAQGNVLPSPWCMSDCKHRMQACTSNFVPNFLLCITCNIMQALKQ